MPHSEINPSAIANLQEIGGKKLVYQMIALFLEHAPLRMNAIIEGQQKRDLNAIEKAAHSLKSSAANLGAMTVFKCAGELEKHAEDGRIDEINPCITDLNSSFQNVILELKEQHSLWKP